MVDEYDTKSFCNETCSESEIIRNKYELKTELKEKLLQLPDVLSFIELLQKYIEKQKKKLRKLKTKLKTLKKYNDASTQTCNNQNNIVEPNDEHSVESKSIAEDIKEAAEIALQNSGFVYEETSGMYYDYNTGYYYNAEYGLYYDGNSGTYLTYNQNTKTYDFHSQVASNEQRSVHDKIAKSHKKRKRKNGANEKDSKRVRNFEHKQSPTGQEVEEGECSLSSDSSEDDNNSDTSDLCKRWPPCMRIIIESSSVPKLKVGSLHIVTCNGGTIGREGNHSLLIPDINISKHHLKIEFEKERNSYTAIDLGSRNGTILNGKRMSTSKQESDPMVVTHGSKIQIGSTTLLCHIHDGNQTCGHCEPGLIQNSDEHQNTKKVPTISESHKNELKKLRKKFGVSNYEADPKLATGYTDRAQKRRDTVGSQNPHEKTQIASVDESISSENKGFKMLSKMGWKEGQSLGKDGEGLKEPIQVLSNKGTSGMGCSETNILSKQTTAINDDKKKIWMKTQERFEKLPIVASFSDESN